MASNQTSLYSTTSLHYTAAYTQHEQRQQPQSIPCVGLLSDFLSCWPSSLLPPYFSQGHRGQGPVRVDQRQISSTTAACIIQQGHHASARRSSFVGRRRLMSAPLHMLLMQVPYIVTVPNWVRVFFSLFLFLVVFVASSCFPTWARSVRDVTLDR